MKDVGNHHRYFLFLLFYGTLWRTVSVVSSLFPSANIMTFEPLQTFKGWSSGPPGISHRIDLDMELRLALCGVVFVALMVTGEWNTLIKFILGFSYMSIDLRCYWRVLVVWISITDFVLNSFLSYREQRTGGWWVITPQVWKWSTSVWLIRF